eukprot:CAMPEP_0171965922 /NCGR_PEP_ID=MMETSP0993-20121228/190157_1 /TAXON_ID=483369 /ORGANISM="non described non described, Strain CCMP2098" /LENGTH=47 /DNA_ID= /DNA_START= /DNA_END= /DNA_ORIENTATION=
MMGLASSATITSLFLEGGKVVAVGGGPCPTEAAPAFAFAPASSAALG